MLWGAFSASGDAAYVKRIVDALESSNSALRGAATWSLRSNAKQHVLVKEILNAEAATRPEAVQAQLLEILATAG
jgi:hypothetical protein